MDSLAVLLADLVVRNAIAIVHHLNFSGAFIGLTIPSIETSIPEIMTHITGSIAIVQNPARLDALSSLLIGTNIGSDMFQQNFVLPLVGIVITIVVVRQHLTVEVSAVIGATLLVLILCIGGTTTFGYLFPYRRNRPDNHDKGHVGGEQNGAADGELDKDRLRRSPVGQGAPMAQKDAPVPVAR